MRFPFVHQRDSMDCGVASLAMVCAWWGKKYSCRFLSEYCCPTTQGVSLAGISQAARALGLETRSARMTLDHLSEIELPAILHWNQNHFTVLYRVKGHGKRFCVADPAKGCIVYSRRDFARRWISMGEGASGRGVAMMLKPGEKFGTVEEPSGNGGGRSLASVFAYLKGYRRHFVQIAAGLMLGCVLQLVLPFLTQWIVDIGIKRADIGFVWLVLLGEMMILAGRTATDFIRSRLLMHISMRVNLSLLSDFFIKLLRLPMKFFDTRLTGDLLQRMTDHKRVQSFLTTQVLNIVFTMMSFVVFGVVLWIYDGVIFGVFAAGSVVYGLWTASFLRRRRLLDMESFELQAQAQNKTYQFVTSMQEIKLQDCGRRRRMEWEDVQADMFDLQMRSIRMEQTQSAGSLLINEVKNILITVLAATAVIRGNMTLGGMLAVQYIIGQLNSPVAQLMGFMYSLQDVKISLERINEIHATPDEEAGRDETAQSDHDPKAGIRLKGVKFRYDRHSPEWTLGGVDMEIPAGKVTAIVGASGSGKSTLVKLMLGYYPPEAGTVEAGGRPLVSGNLHEWRRRCGAVMQEGVIFSETIARNIAAADGEVDSTRMLAAARTACADKFVESFPLGYDTMIGPEGVGISQGQKQRILIARAVYRDPEFIFMDEATNSLDAGNEREIVENLDHFFRGRTVVLVAHRLSTVRNADNIVVIERGRVVEQGTHDTLTALRGVYYSLVKNQLELGL